MGGKKSKPMNMDQYVANNDKGIDSTTTKGGAIMRHNETDRAVDIDTVESIVVYFQIKGEKNPVQALMASSMTFQNVNFTVAKTGNQMTIREAGTPNKVTFPPMTWTKICKKGSVTVEAKFELEKLSPEELRALGGGSGAPQAIGTN
jgi:hypothetical protein